MKMVSILHHKEAACENKKWLIRDYFYWIGMCWGQNLKTFQISSGYN